MFFIHRRTEELIKSESCSRGICMCDDDTWVDIHQLLCASSMGTRRIAGCGGEESKQQEGLVMRGHEGGR